MKFFFLFISLILLQALNVAGQDLKMDGVRIDNHYDVFFEIPHSVSYDNSYYLYFSKDYWLLQRPVDKFRTERREINGRDSVLHTKMGRFYISYVAERGAKIGLVYDSLTAAKPKARYPVDSIIMDQLLPPNHFYPKIDSLASLDRIDNHKTEVIERFKIMNPKPGTPDSLYYYFSKKRISMPFINPSKKNGSLSLYKFEGIIAEKYVETPYYKGPLPRKKWSFEITMIEVKNKTEILKIIERFKIDKKTYLKPTPLGTN